MCSPSFASSCQQHFLTALQSSIFPPFGMRCTVALLSYPNGTSSQPYLAVTRRASAHFAWTEQVVCFYSWNVGSPQPGNPLCIGCFWFAALSRFDQNCQDTSKLEDFYLAEWGGGNVTQAEKWAAVNNNHTNICNIYTHMIIPASISGHLAAAIISSCSRGRK